MKLTVAKPKAVRKPRAKKLAEVAAPEIVAVIAPEEAAMNDIALTVQLLSVPALPAPVKIRKVTGVSRKTLKTLDAIVLGALVDAFGSESRLATRSTASIVDEWATFKGTFSAYVASLIVTELDGQSFENDKAHVAAEQALRDRAHVAEDVRRDLLMKVIVPATVEQPAAPATTEPLALVIA